MADKKQIPELKEKDYERLGRLFKEIYETDFMDTRRFYRMNFIRGILVGMGSVLGATILIAMLIWFLSFFDQAPFIGPIVESIKDTIQE